MPGAGNDHIEPAPAALPVERAKIQGNLSGFIGAIANGEQDNIPFVTLDIFKVLYKQRLMGVGIYFLKLRIFGKGLLKQIVNKVLLNGAEGDHANTELAKLRIGKPPDNFIHHGLGFSPVLLGFSAIIIALHGNEHYLGDMIVGRGEGKEPVFVVVHIGKGNEAFVAGTVMPQKMLLRHGKSQAVIQDALQILLLKVFFIHPVHIKKAGGRKLLGITYHNEVAASCNGAYGLAGRKLGSFVENNEVKGRKFGIQILGHRNRAHEHAGAKLPQKVWDAVKKPSYGNHAATASDGLLQNADFRGVGHIAGQYGNLG